MRTVSLRSLPQGQHVLLSGMTGSGKTTLLRRLLELRRWCIVIDTKYELAWDGWPIMSRVSSVFDNGEHVIYRPRDLSGIEQVLARCYDEGGWSVAIDEIYSITWAPGSASIGAYPPSYVKSLTRGRSRSLTVITGTQRPRFLPLFAMTESSHFFIFEGSPEDAVHLSKLAGIPGLTPRAILSLPGCTCKISGQASCKGHEYLYYSRPARTLVRSRLDLVAA